ncbi:MAG: FAD-dependent oxidoreductase [Candidatus Latescibacteria bacterium]|nr:FAD-dependent oxidoreductase [Candidatus Latescibacterota bacterium]
MEPYLKALADTKYGSLWLDQAIRPEPLAPLARDEKCQLLIVGGGFTGLWAALQAKERMPDSDIILIESTFFGYLSRWEGHAGALCKRDHPQRKNLAGYQCFPQSAQAHSQIGHSRVGLPTCDRAFDADTTRRNPLGGDVLTRQALPKADAHGGKRGLWLKFLDRLHLGFACYRPTSFSTWKNRCYKEAL